VRGHTFRLIRKPAYGQGMFEAICSCGFVARADTQRHLQAARARHKWEAAGRPKRTGWGF
jgi:hypothetical protein